MRPKAELEATTNRRVYRCRYKEVIANKLGICTYCRWHAGENAPRKAKHGHRKLNKIHRGKP